LELSDEIILNQLLQERQERTQAENYLYKQFAYLITEGVMKYQLTREDSFSTYSESLLSFFHNVGLGKFDGRSTIKTYLTQIFFNKCVDLVRKNTTKKQAVHHTEMVEDMLQQLPDSARNIVEQWMESETLAMVRLELERVGDRCKELLLMYEEGYADKLIAEEMGYQNAAVAKTTRLRCLEKLRAKILVRTQFQ
jgi:RNA polymerase sigma factor (sigma-70 family)